MAKKKDPALIRHEQLMKESMDLVLKRAGVSKKILLENAMHRFCNRHYLEYLTPEELEKYSSVIL